MRLGRACMVRPFCVRTVVSDEWVTKAVVVTPILDTVKRTHHVVDGVVQLVAAVVAGLSLVRIRSVRKSGGQQLTFLGCFMRMEMIRWSVKGPAWLRSLHELSAQDSLNHTLFHTYRSI